MKAQGKVSGIFITPKEGGLIHEVEFVEAVSGIGLKGDRNYYKQLEQNPDQRNPDKELTLVELESIDMLNNSENFGTIKPGDLRRNVVTKNIRLNPLVGKQFTVGEVLAEGLDLCEPCRHLEKLTGKKIMEPLVHKAGLRAKIIRNGTIRHGDQITVIT